MWDMMTSEIWKVTGDFISNRLCASGGGLQALLLGLHPAQTDFDRVFDVLAAVVLLADLLGLLVHESGAHESAGPPPCFAGCTPKSAPSSAHNWPSRWQIL